MHRIRTRCHREHLHARWTRSCSRKHRHTSCFVCTQRICHTHTIYPYCKYICAHIAVCTTEKCINVYKQCGCYVFTHCIHINTQFTHRNTEFTRTHTCWHAGHTDAHHSLSRTHKHTCILTHHTHNLVHSRMPQPTRQATQRSVFLFLLPSCPPTLFLSCSLGNSKTLPVKRIPQLPTLERTFQVVSTYCFLCLFSSLLLLFGLEELNEKWPIN